jgi:O-antigen ligase
MTAAAARARLPVSLATTYLVGSGLAVAVGVGVAVDLRLGVALAFAALTVPLALVDLPAVIALWVALTVFSRQPGFGLAISAAGLVALCGWLAQLRADPAAVRSTLRPHARLLTLFAALLVWLTLTLLWAQDSGAALSGLVYWYANGAAIVVLVTAIRTPRDLRLVVVAVVGAVVAAVVLALAGIDPGGAQAAADAGPTYEGRLQGVFGDPNFMAAFILPTVVLLAALGNMVPVQVRVLLLPTVVVLVIGFAGTVSRGGMVGALAAFVTAVVVMRGRRAAVLGAAALAALVLAVWLAGNPAAMERLQSTEDRGSGREDIWLVARRVSGDHPVGGIGLDNFTVRSREYVRRPGTLEYVELIVDRPHVVHNTYLQMLAETGIVGLGLFLAILATAVGSAIRAARVFHHAGERALARISRGVIVADVGLLAAAVFISLQDTATFWVVLFLGPVLLGLAHGRSRGPAGSGLRHARAQTSSARASR